MTGHLGSLVSQLASDESQSNGNSANDTTSANDAETKKSTENNTGIIQVALQLYVCFTFKCVYCLL